MTTIQLLKKLSTPLLLGVFSLTITACGGSSDGHYYDDDYHHTDGGPRLNQFDMIDTYNTNSEFDWQTYLALSPVVNSGQFEVFWDVDSDYDYFVELRINDIPSTDGSRLITSDLCGPYFYCHDHQYQFCDYTNSLNIVCELPDGSTQGEYIGDMLETIPQDMFFIVQVCDTGFYYCEYETHQVSME